jgi:hypothetical protein
MILYMFLQSLVKIRSSVLEKIADYRSRGGGGSGRLGKRVKHNSSSTSRELITHRIQAECYIVNLGLNVSSKKLFLEYRPGGKKYIMHAEYANTDLL